MKDNRKYTVSLFVVLAAILVSTGLVAAYGQTMRMGANDHADEMMTECRSMMASMSTHCQSMRESVSDTCPMAANGMMGMMHENGMMQHSGDCPMYGQEMMGVSQNEMVEDSQIGCH